MIVYRQFLIFIFTALFALQAQAQNTYHHTYDGKMENFITSLLNKMTLEEKIGQLNLLDYRNFKLPAKTYYVRNIKDGHCGTLLNVTSPAYIRRLQQIAVDSTRLHIPLMFGFDVIHGFKTVFPVPIAMSCTWDTAMIEHAARLAADEASLNGLDWVYSPMVDITRDPRWGRVMEGAGEDPFLGSKIAKAYVKGYQGTDLNTDSTVMACVKHFALYGAVEAGREYNSVDMGSRRMFQFYLPPYKAAVDAGVGSIMTSFNTINGIPSSADEWLLTGLLRKKWGFKGFIVSDYNAVLELISHGLAADKKQAAYLSMNAGVDMDMTGKAYISSLEELVKEGKIDLRQVNNAVRYVLEAKYKLGLFNNPYLRIDNKRPKAGMMNSSKLKFAREIARESVVLLKNKNNLLPLEKSGTIALIGPLADDQQDMIGGWSGEGNWHQAVSILQGVKSAVGDKAHILYAKGSDITEDTSMARVVGGITLSEEQPENLLREAVKTARKADVVVMCLGESQGMTGEGGSRADIHLPACQQKLLQAVYETGKPVVLVLSNGRPLVLKWENEHISSILETWFLGTEAGNAIADVLFGDYNPSGKITMSFPYAVGQIPVYYNELNPGRPRISTKRTTSRYVDIPNVPLFPFGYGLSYTHFTFSDFILDKEKIHPDDSLYISVKITNDGKHDGSETVQLYIRDMVASVAQPVKELKGFKSVFLRKEESKTVHFVLTADDLKFYNKEGKWIYEPGVFKVFVGGNSRDVKEEKFLLEN